MDMLEYNGYKRIRCPITSVKVVIDFWSILTLLTQKGYITNFNEFWLKLLNSALKQ